jgi:amidase
MIVAEDRPTGIEQTHDIFFGLGAADGGAGIQMLLQMIGTEEAHPWLLGFQQLAAANAITTSEYGNLMMKWSMFRCSMTSFMEKYDAIICPVCAYPAPPHNTSFDSFPAFSYTMTYNLTGWPGLVVRGGTSPEGLPIGVQVVARPWREDVALAVGRHIESALGGWGLPPI